MGWVKTAFALIGGLAVVFAVAANPAVLADFGKMAHDVVMLFAK